MRQTGPSLEAPGRAKASQWAERGQGADARQPKSEPEVQLLVRLMRDLAKSMICSLNALIRMRVRDVSLLLSKPHSLESRSGSMHAGWASPGCLSLSLSRRRHRHRGQS